MDQTQCPAVKTPSINCLGDGTVSSNTGVRTDFVRKPTYIPSFRNLTGNLLCLHYKEQPNELFRENNFVSSEIHTRLCGHRSTTGHSGEETRSRLYRGSKYVSSRQLVPTLCYSRHSMTCLQQSRYNERLGWQHCGRIEKWGTARIMGNFCNIILTAYCVCVKIVCIKAHCFITFL